MRALTVQPEEVDVLATAQRPGMAEWAEDNYVLSPETSEIAGPWSNDYVPFLVPIMGWLSDVATRQVTVCACTQAGKTELANIMVGYTCDVEPAPTLLTMPREDDANRRVATRIRPMFKANTDLQKHLKNGRLDNLNVGKETILDNMILFIAWANSPAALADNPVAKVILDEVGKYPAASGKETDPISLAKKRQRTFRSRSKLLVISTPVLEGDLFDAEYNRGDRCQWWAKCPFCGTYHILIWANVEMDKDGDGKLLHHESYRAGGHARYKCPHCKHIWGEYDRFEAIRAGRFVPAGCTMDQAGRVAGKPPATTHHSCRITALMLHPIFQTIDDLAAEWAQAQQAKHGGNIKPLQDFINAQLGEPWQEREMQTDITPLRSHVTGFAAGTVPEGVRLLTAGVDVQADHVWVVLLGWGYLSEVWLIEARRLETGDMRELANYQLVRQFAASTWPLAKEPDTVMRIAATAVDCGYRTDTVQDFCRQCTESRVLPVRGDDRVKNAPYHAFKLPDRVSIRYDINVHLIKDRLYRLLFDCQRPGPGYFHLPAETSQETLQQLASEEKRTFRIRGRHQSLWVQKSGRPNHIWDACVYASFVAELVGARLLSDEKALPKRTKVVGRPVGRRAIRTRY
jgi:phage terminase large subunit GpA-like protein